MTEALKELDADTDAEKEELEETVGNTVPVPDGLREFWTGLGVKEDEGLGVSVLEKDGDGDSDATSHVKQPNV